MGCPALRPVAFVMVATVEAAAMGLYMWPCARRIFLLHLFLDFLESLEIKKLNINWSY